jgi:phosphoribosylformylglycinamidine synthase
MDLKRVSDPLYIVGVTRPELGGSEYYRLMGFLGASVPRLKPKEAVETYKRVLSAMDRGLIRACHDPSEGGLAVSAAEMAFTGGLGLEIDLDAVPLEGEMRDDYILFSESNARLLIEVDAMRRLEFEEEMRGTPHALIGWITDGDSLTIKRDDRTILDVALEDLMRAWKTPLGA